MTGERTNPEPDEPRTIVEPWAQRHSVDEIDEHETWTRDGRSLADYFERMRERGLLD